MGATKSHIHDESHIKTSRIAKVFAHPARIAILSHIVKHKQCSCIELSEKISLSQPTISQHLTVIKNQGVLIGKYEGKELYYTIKPHVIEEMQQDLSDCLMRLKS
ncbi:MAG: transcriptional regulator [Cytophagaceae bacterium]|nr:transcriptional regulator [Cytophagaceae bacterium]|tara:strand:- start:30841 stop:31155 length:315 start_codon:yes stop_codon:yes gene_type:complete